MLDQTSDRFEGKSKLWYKCELDRSTGNATRLPINWGSSIRRYLKKTRTSSRRSYSSGDGSLYFPDLNESTMPDQTSDRFEGKSKLWYKCELQQDCAIRTKHQSSDGEEVSCVDKMSQPAFHNPLLKHNKFQEQPSEIPTEFGTIQKSSRQTFEAQISMANCPEGTVPIRSDNTTIIPRTRPGSSAYAPGHEYAIMTTNISTTSRIHGTKATINVWNPAIERPEAEMSISQIWLLSGKFERGDLNTIEVGWQVLPSMYKDSKLRLFIFWTSDACIATGCYNVRCPGFPAGFIQTSSRIVIGGVISPISSFGGSQFEITIHVWKDEKSGNWWLSLGRNDSLVGYWPREIFTTLADHADRVEWGGEILNSNTSGHHTTTQMGSGHFPSEGFRKASYFRNLKIVNNSNHLQSIRGLTRMVTDPEYYNLEDDYTEEWKTHFFYGGPLVGPTNSGIVPLALSLTSFYFLLALLLSFRIFFYTL